MAYSLTWLPDVLLEAGLKVAQVEGWQTRGRGDVGPIRGVICHHTAGAAHGNMPSLGVITQGRPAGPHTAALAGPLAQLGLGRDGTFYVIAAGKANHAGGGKWAGITTGNTSFIGIEAENTGTPSDTPWPAVQLDAYHRGVAAILKEIGANQDLCCAHREYALPAGRKTDPDFNMAQFRAEVAAILAGTATIRPLIPAQDKTGRATLRRGASGAGVKTLQTALAITADGDFGPTTEAALRSFQRSHGLVGDGIAGPKTWSALSL